MYDPIRTFSIPEFAKTIKTNKENIYLLVKYGYIETLSFGSRDKKITAVEADRFLNENRGKDFSQILNDLKKREELKKVNNQVIELREVGI